MPNQADRLSPAPLKSRASYEFSEAPTLLDERYVVSSPEKVIDKLRSVQQKAWDELKTVKGRAWKSFIRKQSNDRGTVGLLDFSLSQNPRKSKILMYYQYKAFEDYKNGKVTDVGGQDPDSKDALYCVTAIIRTPELMVLATGYLRNGWTKLKSPHRRKE